MNATAWSKAGFLLMTGLALGMIVSDLTSVPTAEAAVASRYEEYCVATGQSFDGEIDVLWLLDYKLGVLQCLIVDRQGKLGSLGRVDLVEQMELEGGKRVKPHFMVVTGRFGTRGTDFCYVIETESGQVLVCEPPNVSGAQRGQPQVPNIISKFRYRQAGD